MSTSRIGVLLASLCVTAAINAQSMFRGDATHSGRYAGPAPRQFHRVKWKFPTGDRVISSPVFKDNVIYFGGDDGNVYAVDAATGRQIWKRATNGPVPATPAIADGKVFFATSDSSLYHVVDANSGKSVVRQQGKAYMFSSPAIVGDVVFIGVLNGTLEARDAKTGELLWDFQVGTSKQNKRWVLTADRTFNVPLLYHSNWREAPLVANDQQIRIGGIFSSPLVANGVVYFGSADGFLYALE